MANGHSFYVFGFSWMSRKCHKNKANRHADSKHAWGLVEWQPKSDEKKGCKNLRKAPILHWEGATSKQKKKKNTLNEVNRWKETEKYLWCSICRVHCINVLVIKHFVCFANDPPNEQLKSGTKVSRLCCTAQYVICVAKASQTQLQTHKRGEELERWRTKKRKRILPILRRL